MTQNNQIQQAIDTLLSMIAISESISDEDKNQIYSMFSDANISDEEITKRLIQLCDSEVLSTQNEITDLKKILIENNEYRRNEEIRIRDDEQKIKEELQSEESHLYEDIKEKTRDFSKELDSIEHQVSDQEDKTQVDDIKNSLLNK